MHNSGCMLGRYYIPQEGGKNIQKQKGCAVALLFGFNAKLYETGGTLSFFHAW